VCVGVVVVVVVVGGMFCVVHTHWFVESKVTTLNLIEGCSIALLFKMRLDNYRFVFMSISML